MIQVTDKYCIEVDDRQYIVYLQVISQGDKTKGEVVQKNPTYHSTMVDALNNIIHRMQKDKLNTDTVMTLQESINKLQEIKEEFTKLLGRIQGLEDYG